jgi:hypothetical protein
VARERSFLDDSIEETKRFQDEPKIYILSLLALAPEKRGPPTPLFHLGRKDIIVVRGPGTRSTLLRWFYKEDKAYYVELS